MSLRLVYIGAAAALAPAASLRALAGGGAVVVPADLDPELRALIGDVADPGEGRVLEVDPRDEAALDELVRQARAGSPPAPGSGGDDATHRLTVALAGPSGPPLARALRARLTPADLITVPEGPAFDDALLGQEVVSLKRIVDVLRVECPWDREQTAQDIVSYTVEEVLELADAIEADDLHELHAELGDVLLQVVILAMMLAERDAGDLGSVAHDIEVKLVRRHPHIFADAVANTGAEVKQRWERIKREQEGREGIFHDVPAGFPALLYARKLQQRAGSVGFDWPTARQAFPKVAEEHGELGALFDEAAATGADPDRHDPRLVHEVGDLLFAVVNVARLAHVDPELALRRASRRFERRVCAADELARNEGRDWATLGLPEQEHYYQRAKAAELPDDGDGDGAADEQG